ncbi:hypothetical protein Y1Q_0021825 [Alligator mississippiensis]|uniref:Uncharacterized protein n=1 Tax=Alligator mississippiensis TaxID=8496 RepID=A0A151PBE8_ALLMI|nr:hypothetical protein Y1Q_0021825 [Alligator mississippiensis]
MPFMKELDHILAPIEPDEAWKVFCSMGRLPDPKPGPADKEDSQRGACVSSTSAIKPRCLGEVQREILLQEDKISCGSPLNIDPCDDYALQLYCKKTATLISMKKKQQSPRIQDYPNTANLDKRRLNPTNHMCSNGLPITSSGSVGSPTSARHWERINTEGPESDEKDR